MKFTKYTPQDIMTGKVPSNNLLTDEEVKENIEMAKTLTDDEIEKWEKEAKAFARVKKLLYKHK